MEETARIHVGRNSSKSTEYAPGDVVADAKYKEMSMKTVSMKTKAWVTSTSSLSSKDLLEGKSLDRLHFSNHDMLRAGWTFAGDAELTVTVLDEKTLIDNRVAALREEEKSIRAEATARVTRIEGQIQSLLAITCESSLVTEPL